MQDILTRAKHLFVELEALGEPERIDLLNELRRMLHAHSPFKEEPVDCIQWIPTEEVRANDYNPNIVAPPEMKLLQRSIKEDGYTQPIVAWKNGGYYEVVDGFHRNRVAREYKPVSERIRGYLPLSVINADREGRGDRIASTIRHNRARGKHTVEGMSDIILELKNRNWKNERIARELGMDSDEILRLCQITGLAGLFVDRDFSKSWDVEDSEIDDFIPIDDDIGLNEGVDFRHLNVDDPNRVFHTYDKWECQKAGFYNRTMDGMNREECEQAYADFLRDSETFSEALDHVITEWKHSCEHYLTNVAMNRIAWLGQAAMCHATSVPAVFRGGFNLLTKEEQDEANRIALVYLNLWLDAQDKEIVEMQEALSFDRQVEIY
jgi:ParB-like chromosome segregation protein Spo0J